MVDVKRGDIVIADLGDFEEGHEIAKVRPCVVVQNDVGNVKSPTTIVCPMTTKIKNFYQKTHVVLNGRDYKFKHNLSMILAEQIITIDKSQIHKNVGKLKKKDLAKVDEALMVSILRYIL